MAIAFVQASSAAFPQDSGATQAINITWTGGNLGVVCMFGYVAAGTPALTSVIGSSSGTWTVAKSGDVNSNRQLVIYYKENITAGADTLTTTWSPDLSGGSRIVALEYSGVSTTSPLGSTTSNAFGGSNTTMTLTLNPFNSNSLYIGLAHSLTDTTIGSYTHTQRSEAETFGACSVQDTIGSGSTTMTWTLGASSFWQQVGVTFKPPVTNTGNMLGLF